jgi:hypothetical protein
MTNRILYLTARVYALGWVYWTLVFLFDEFSEVDGTGAATGARFACFHDFFKGLTISGHLYDFPIRNALTQT